MSEVRPQLDTSDNFQSVMMIESNDVQEIAEIENQNEIQKNSEINIFCEDVRPLEVIEEAPRSRRRGKALAWKYVKTYENMEDAMEQYTKQKLLANEMIRGRKSIGKANAFYFNCQKMSCGCKKKWRLLASPTSPDVVEEETYEDHSKHEFFARNGGFGMTFDQVQITNEALSRYPMKPLQIYNHFGVLAAEALSRGNSTLAWELNSIPQKSLFVILFFLHFV